MKKRLRIYNQYSGQVIEMLKFGPLTHTKVAGRLGLQVHDVRDMFRSMKTQRLIHWQQESLPASLLNWVADKDPSPFPKPWWKTPNVGFYG